MSNVVTPDIRAVLAGFKGKASVLSCEMMYSPKVVTVNVKFTFADLPEDVLAETVAMLQNGESKHWRLTVENLTVEYSSTDCGRQTFGEIPMTWCARARFVLDTRELK